MRNELDIQTLRRAKANASNLHYHGDSDSEFWYQCVADIDEEIMDISKQEAPEPMYGKARLGVMAVIILILLTIALSGCLKTLEGFSADLHHITRPATVIDK